MFMLYTCAGPVQSRRPFSDQVFKIGEPNLLVVPPGEQNSSPSPSSTTHHHHPLHHRLHHPLHHRLHHPFHLLFTIISTINLTIILSTFSSPSFSQSTLAVHTQTMSSRQRWPCTWRVGTSPSPCPPMRRCWCVVNKP